MTLTAFVLRVLAAVLGLFVARRHPTYRPMARGLVGLLALSAARWASTWPARGAAPYAGASRGWWSVEQGTTWASYAGAAGVVWLALRAPNDASPRVSPPEGRRKIATYVVVAVAASVGAAWLAYPLVRGPRFESTLTAIAWASAAVQVHALFRWATRPRPHPRPPIPAVERVALALAISALASAGGPYLLHQPVRDWWLAPWVGIATWLAVLVLESLALRQSPPRE